MRHTLFTFFNGFVLVQLLSCCLYRLEFLQSHTSGWLKEMFFRAKSPYLLHNPDTAKILSVQFSCLKKFLYTYEEKLPQYLGKVINIKGNPLILLQGSRILVLQNNTVKRNYITGNRNSLIPEDFADGDAGKFIDKCIFLMQEKYAAGIRRYAIIQ